LCILGHATTRHIVAQEVFSLFSPLGNKQRVGEVAPEDGDVAEAGGMEEVPMRGEGVAGFAQRNM
jgi:hypothetical protein